MGCRACTCLLVDESRQATLDAHRDEVDELQKQIVALQKENAELQSRSPDQADE